MTIENFMVLMKYDPFFNLVQIFIFDFFSYKFCLDPTAIKISLCGPLQKGQTEV